MRMKSMATLLALFAQILSAGALAAESGLKTTIPEVRDFTRAFQIFESLCMAKAPNGRSYVLVNKHIHDGGATLDCKDEAIQYGDWAVALQKKYPKEMSEALDHGNCPYPKGDAFECVNTLRAHLENLPGACNAREKAESSIEACMVDVGCDVARSVFNAVPGGKFGSEYFQSLGGGAGKCLKSNQNDCFSSFVAGIVKDIVSQVKSLGKIGKLASDGFHWLFADKSANAVSKKMHMVSHMSSDAIAKFLADPVGSVAKITSALYKMFSDAARENFSCSLWSGKPYQSQCLSTTPKSWDCASCGQKMDGICGAVGALGGEVITMVVGGALIGAVLKGGIVAGEAITEATTVLIRSSETLTCIAKVTTKMIAFSAESIAEIQKLYSPAVDAVIALSRKAIDGAHEAILVAARHPIVRPAAIVLEKTTGATTYVVGATLGNYFKLLDRAFKYGMMAGDEATMRLLKKAGWISTDRATRTIGGTASVAVRTSEAHLDPKIVQDLKDSYVPLVKQNSSMEPSELAAKIHDMWMAKAQDSLKASKPWLFRPYEELSPSEKIKDVDSMLEAAKKAGVPLDDMRSYRSSLQTEIDAAKEMGARATSATATADATVNRAVTYPIEGDEVKALESAQSRIRAMLKPIYRAGKSRAALKTAPKVLSAADNLKSLAVAKASFERAVSEKLVPDADIPVYRAAFRELRAEYRFEQLSETGAFSHDLAHAIGEQSNIRSCMLAIAKSEVGITSDALLTLIEEAKRAHSCPLSP